MASCIENHSSFLEDLPSALGSCCTPRAPIKGPVFTVLGRLWQTCLTLRILKALWMGVFMGCCPELAKNGKILPLLISPTFIKQQCVLSTKAQAKETKARVKQHWVESRLPSATRGNFFSFMSLTYLEMGTVKPPLWAVIRINKGPQPAHRCS